MFRLHKQVCREVKLAKSGNVNKERNDKKYKIGTSQGFLCGVSNRCRLLEETNAQILGHDPDPTLKTAYWNQRHPDQEIHYIHDRTRWKSSKSKDLIRKKARTETL